MKRILITGANSYIGEHVRDFLLQYPDSYSVDVKDTIGWNPEPADFSGIDVVFNVAGIAHIKETAENRHLYYEINRDLVISIAKAAKVAGAHQFILLSSMSVYGLLTGRITKNTEPNPNTAYGDSKLQADIAIESLNDESFRVACLRPPMVYGKGCKGNYQSLRSFALKSPIFPDFKNQRSMVFIGNLCEFVKNAIDNRSFGLFFPQNADYINTSEMVRIIADDNEKSIRLTRFFNWVIKILPIRIIKKVFGDLTYEPVDLIYKYSFAESIHLTEENDK